MREPGGCRFLQQRSTPPTGALAPTVIAEYLAVACLPTLFIQLRSDKRKMDGIILLKRREVKDMKYAAVVKRQLCARNRTFLDQLFKTLLLIHHCLLCMWMCEGEKLNCKRRKNNDDTLSEC